LDRIGWRRRRGQGAEQRHDDGCCKQHETQSQDFPHFGPPGTFRRPPRVHFKILFPKAAAHIGPSPSSHMTYTGWVEKRALRAWSPDHVPSPCSSEGMSTLFKVALVPFPQ